MTTLRQGWFFTGQHSAHLGERRGTDPAGLRPEQFVVCIQNHDQIGNRADGGRLNHEVDLATYRALSALLTFVPNTPLLFMGQEWAASSPFMFFTDHAPDLGRKVTEGRRQEFSAFSAFADPAKREAIPDPQSPETFEQSRLDWGEISRPPHAGIRRLYQRMLELRPHGRAYDVRALGDAALIATRGDLSLVVRLSGSGPVAIPHAGSTWRDVVVTTEDDDIASEPAPIRVDTAAPLTVTFARPGAILLRRLRS